MHLSDSAPSTTSSTADERLPTRIELASAPQVDSSFRPRLNWGGSIRLFRLAGTDVYCHCSWFLLAYFLLQDPFVSYSSWPWHLAELLAGVGLILIHEFAHVFVCRWVGGHADRIFIWPLGGIAFCAIAPRPRALFWAVGAGPFVHLVLAPGLWFLRYLTQPDENDLPTDLHQFLCVVEFLNLFMLVINLLPVYPLDGGQLFQAVLWPLVGRAWAQGITATVGVILGVALGILAAVAESWWFTVVFAMVALGAAISLIHSVQLARMARAERRTGLRCPTCHLAPPIGNFWICDRCYETCDPFGETRACSQGGEHRMTETCPECNRDLTRSQWEQADQVEKAQDSGDSGI